MEKNDQDVVLFGETNFRGVKRRFGIKRTDRRRHMYIIGKTGMGKTTLLENMTIQDIQRGEGVGIVDPHGEYAERMLDFVPKSRINDVIYFNPSNLENPIAFNVLEDVGVERRHLVSSGLLGVFKKIWPDVWSARMEYLLSNSILALLETPGSTLLGINRMLTDKEYRKSVVKSVTDPIVKAFWENEYASYSERFAIEAGAAVQNKIGQFTSNPLIRNIIGQAKSSIDMRRIMDEKKIFIMNLSKGRIGEENSRLLGAMLITRLYLAAMTRIDLPEEKREDFYLYVDEFQNFATESFANILSEARKYRLNLILAHQYVAQMDEKVQDAVFGNVGSMLTFRVGAADAELLEKEFSPEFMIPDIVNLGFANIYLRLMIDGVASRPFSATTLPPVQRDEVSHSDEIILTSSKQYGSNRKEVEQKIMDWQGFGPDTRAGGSGLRVVDIREFSKNQPRDTRPPLRVSPSRPEPQFFEDHRPSRAGNTSFEPRKNDQEERTTLRPDTNRDYRQKPEELRPAVFQKSYEKPQETLRKTPQQTQPILSRQPEVSEKSFRPVFDIRKQHPPTPAPPVHMPDKTIHEDKKISLSALKPRIPAEKTVSKIPRSPEIPKKSVNFDELKKALSKAFVGDENKDPKEALRDYTGMLRPREEASTPKGKSSSNKKSGVLKPGEKITFN